jgi:hypothetical protein
LQNLRLGTYIKTEGYRFPNMPSMKYWISRAIPVTSGSSIINATFWRQEVKSESHYQSICCFNQYLHSKNALSSSLFPLTLFFFSHFILNKILGLTEKITTVYKLQIIEQQIS